MNIEQITNECLVEMFRRVGLEYSIEQINEYAKDTGAEWFQSKTWSTEEEDAFRDWMDAHLRTKTRWTARQRSREIGMFLFMCGWKSEN